MTYVKQVRLMQIVTGQWDGPNGLTYSTIGLADDGTVYRYEFRHEGWRPFNMQVLPRWEEE